MISLKSLYNFFYINGLIITLGTIQYLTINYSNNIVLKFAITFLEFSFKNYFFVKLIDYNLRNKEKIKNDVTKEDYKNEFAIAFLSSTLVETVTYMIITALLFHNSQINLYDFLYFIPLSFVFEFIFDFFHYWTHRISHTNFFLYKYSHKSHHKYILKIKFIINYIC
jgi:sterol desaturase/sphingolipid hydroxylase (fatty acid hydroxylase superfamily)